MYVFTSLCMSRPIIMIGVFFYNDNRQAIKKKKPSELEHATFSDLCYNQNKSCKNDTKLKITNCHGHNYVQ